MLQLQFMKMYGYRYRQHLKKNLNSLYNGLGRHIERKQRLSLEHLKLLRRRDSTKRDVLELLKRLQDLFLPIVFKKFIEVRDDFRYHDCKRGTDYYSAPFPTWPKFMIITTRTDLSIDKPAAVGYLDFHYKQFRSEIERLFSKYYGRRFSKQL